MPVKTLVFDIFGDLAHFRKFYTTSSPLTFPFPPPPTVKGILGAICGIGKKEYLKVFAKEHCALSVRLNSPVEKIRMGLNHINTKGNVWVPLKKKNHGARTQIRTEFLKNPSFRIYFSHQDERLFNKLEKNLKEHKSVFTPSLGLSELLADFKYIRTEEMQKKTHVRMKVNSVLPIKQLDSVEFDFEEERKYFKENIPADMIEDRIVSSYQEVLFEYMGSYIIAVIKEGWQGESGEGVVFIG